ncbi:hypothetical protein VTL71DRAFT_7686 [Oculimacula yallundae]|uniref:Cytochrome b5 heme-binding domain-containing protein n=1 Tax=Oculimacula yallundae TaxID=86028 RepID=A0ABR4BUX3_9HELO
MVLLGLSILIASVSFLCYRHPPTSWTCFHWFRPSIENGARKQNGTLPPQIPEKKSLEEKKKKDEYIATPKKNDIQLPIITKPNPPPDTNHVKADLDRKAMPPPPPPFKKQLPLRNPQAPLSVPTFSLGNGITDGQDEEDEEPSAPSFPAMNSAQRASGGTSGPPKLNAQPSPGLMLPPSRSPLPNRGPPPSSSSQSSLLPPPTHTSIPSKPRRKVLLTPGHSPLDWARLTSTSSNLNGLPPSTPFLRVPPSLLKQFNGRKGKDAWTVLGGKVYNISPYVEYHPGGGPELLKAAGRDGSRLFGEVHPWVNWEGMLESCMVGVAVEEGEVRRESALEEMD